ncbi:hypothetical protein ACVWW1_008416 [Bradyrhizobium sp. JR3.5]
MERIITNPIICMPTASGTVMATITVMTTSTVRIMPTRMFTLTARGTVMATVTMTAITPINMIRSTIIPMTTFTPTTPATVMPMITDITNIMIASTSTNTCTRMARGIATAMEITMITHTNIRTASELRIV